MKRFTFNEEITYWTCLNNTSKSSFMKIEVYLLKIYEKWKKIITLIKFDKSMPINQLKKKKTNYMLYKPMYKTIMIKKIFINTFIEISYSSLCSYWCSLWLQLGTRVWCSWIKWNFKEFNLLLWFVSNLFKIATIFVSSLFFSLCNWKNNVNINQPKCVFFRISLVESHQY